VRLLTPADEGYEAVRRPAIDTFADAHPAAVAMCASADDVAEALAYARERAMRVVPRSGGHCFAGRSSTGGVVIDVSPMASVELDGERAVIGAGARLASVYDVLAAEGRTLPAGCGPDVGVAGLTLGGGLGILGRLHGLLADSLVAAEVVLADGRAVTCDEQREPDLFWALRGAGGCAFGVVTSLTFATVTAPAATGFRLLFDPADAAAVVDAWQRWSPDGPRELAASLLVTAPADPAEPLEVCVAGSMVGGEADTLALLGQLPAEPVSSAHAAGTHRDAKRFLVGTDDSAGGMFASRNEFFREPLPREAVEALIAGVERDRVAGQARELDFSPWGGAYNDVAEHATAFAHRGERFLLKQTATVTSMDDWEPGWRWVTGSWSRTRPYGTARAYVNFPDPLLDDWPRWYHAGNYGRLREVKRRYDAQNVLRFHQSVEP
jgi:FAD/FMN-containing dehydrogenase